jgi:DNA sulfur modification protein DndD
LASEQYSFINHLKQNIKQFVVDEPESQEMRIASAAAELKMLRRELSELRTEMDEIRNESLASAADSTKALAEELNVLLGKQSEFTLGLAKIDDFPEANVDENSLSIRGLQRELKKVRDMIAQITGTVELKLKIDLIISVAERAKEIARRRLRDAIRNDCNQRLSKVLSGDPICIDKIHQSLSLHNQDGASVGQTLAVGYTFLTTLLNRGIHKFPLVVDSPAGPLDDLVRGQVGRLIPGLCDQFVAFTISTEREHFLPALEDAVGDSIVYLTAFRTSTGMKQMMDEVPPHALRTKNGIVVSGREYFMSFVIPQEQE